MIDKKDTGQWACFHLLYLINSQSLSSKCYSSIKPSIAIIITKYNIIWIKDSSHYHNTYKFYNKENDSLFGGTMTIHTVEPTKLKDNDVKTSLYNWIKFFNSKSKEEFKMASTASKVIAKAVKK